MEALLQLDRALFLWINNGLASPWLDPVFYLWSYLGNAPVTFGLLVALALLLRRQAFLKEHLLWLAAAALLGGWGVHWLKDVVGRYRPVKELAPLIEAGKAHVHLVGTVLTRSSFPSGHSQIAFAFATYLSFALPRWWPVFLPLAFGVMLSRIYMGVHFPADCLTGGAIGAISALLFWKVRALRLPRRGKARAPGCNP